MWQIGFHWKHRSVGIHFLPCYRARRTLVLGHHHGPRNHRDQKAEPFWFLPHHPQFQGHWGKRKGHWLSCNSLWFCVGILTHGVHLGLYESCTRLASILSILPVHLYFQRRLITLLEHVIKAQMNFPLRRSSECHRDCIDVFRLFQLNPIIPTNQNVNVMSPDSQSHITSSAPSPYPEHQQVRETLSYMFDCNDYRIHLDRRSCCK